MQPLPVLSHTRPPAQLPPAGWRDLIVVGAHGGAGVTTLAALLRDALGGAAWRVYDLPPRLPPDPHGRPLVLVTRGTVPSAGRAIRAVTVLAREGIPLTAMAVVADGVGREPAEAAARFRLLAGRAGEIVRVPFVAGLRLVDDPAEVRLPKQAARAVARLAQAVAGAPATGPVREER